MNAYLPKKQTGQAGPPRSQGADRTEKIQRSKPADPLREILFYTEILLILCGMAILYSNSSAYILQRHLIWLSLGLIIAAVLYFIPITAIFRIIPLLAYLSLLINLLPHIPSLKLSSAGSPRWISIYGLSFQTSEVLRISLILYLARCFHLAKGSLWDPHQLWAIGYLFLTAVFIILQKDYSTTILLILTGTSVAVIAGSLATIFTSLATIGISTVIALFYLGQDFRNERIFHWLSGEGYQINWIYNALSSGGFWGKGLGTGSIKNVIPAKMTDFPLATVAEEVGFIGITFVMALYLTFTLIGCALAARAKISFLRYSLAGLSSVIFIQSSVNFGVTSGLLPVTGQPLPFFSVGGSATLINIVIFGLINRFSKIRGDVKT